jgi:hypothetical protein
VKRKRWKPAAGAVALGLVGLTLGACGSSGEGETTTQPPPISATNANRLAGLSDEIATDLEAGETCSAAYSADDLKDAVEGVRMSPALRSTVAEVAERLVDEVNCPPPPPPPEPEKKPKKPKDNQDDEHGHGDDQGNRGGDGDGESGGDGDGNDSGRGNSDHGGLVPPGQAKLKGEEDG